jgi:hypothetical protein
LQCIRITIPVSLWNCSVLCFVSMCVCEFEHKLLCQHHFRESTKQEGDCLQKEIPASVKLLQQLFFESKWKAWKADF